MQQPAIVKNAEDLWSSWNIRVCIIGSLLIQIVLTFVAPMRKTHNKIKYVIWVLYLMADSIALYVLGQITNGPTGSTPSSTDLLVFWSPFLLVHLGGPDTISALAIEDNELWLRHLLQVFTLAFGIGYLFYRSFHGKPYRPILIPAVIMFVDGFVKYLERTGALYLASMDRFRESLTGEPDPGPNYAALMEEYSSRLEANIPVTIKSNLEEKPYVQKDAAAAGLTQQGSSHNSSSTTGTAAAVGNTSQTSIDVNYGKVGISERVLVEQAYVFYKDFRGLIADIMFSFKEREDSLKFFLESSRTASDAFKVVEIELNFMYDAFYTKVNMLLVLKGIPRLFSFAAVISSLLFFYFILDKRSYDKQQVYISYVLLWGAITMDTVALVMHYFSDWAAVAASKCQKYCCNPFPAYTVDWWFRIRPRRWSKKISQYDLLYYCLNDHHKLFTVLLVKTLIDEVTNFFYVRKKSFDDRMADLIFRELTNKANHVADRSNPIAEEDRAKLACDARGNLVFCKGFSQYSEKLKPWTTQADYDESLLLWHIATDLCISESVTRNEMLSEQGCIFRNYSKMLSSYMAYLLIIQPTMTSAVAGIAQVRINDTCAETKKFIRRKLPQRPVGKLEKLKRIALWPFNLIKRLILWLFHLAKGLVQWLLHGAKNLGVGCRNCCCKKSRNDAKNTELEPLDSKVELLCRKLRDVKTYWKPQVVKGDRSKSVLFDACQLADQLIEISPEERWEVTFKVWVELLCYAAARCGPTAHLKQLTEGGELITLVWLLMAHLGLGEQFRINKGTGWAKLIVDK